MSYITNTIKILQYRADNQDGHPLDDWIAGWSGIWNPKTPPYSHSEICFSDGICFSAASRGEFTGTRFEDYEIVTRNKNRWDLYTIEVNLQKEKEIIDRARNIVGKKYYYAGLFLDFFLPFGLLGSLFFKNEWYCSQAVYYCLTGKRMRISPKRLYLWLVKNGYKFIGNLIDIDK